MEGGANTVALVAWSGFALAVIFGAVGNKVNFCTMGAVSDIVNMGDWGRMRMWLLAIAVAILGAHVLQAAGLPLVPSVLVQSADDAVAVATVLGLPVVAKLQSHAVLHKSDVGAVMTDLRSEHAVREAFTALAALVPLNQPLRAADGEGIILQPMVHGGLETLIGITHDPLFGPLIAFGLGGVAVELLGDVHFAEVDYFHGVGPWYGQFRWSSKKAEGGSSLLSAGCHALDALLLLMGGEVAAMALIEAAVRLIPGVLGDAASPDEESFARGLLEYPQFTRPQAFEDRPIPEVLNNGNHSEISKWRQAQSEGLTRLRRPDLWALYEKGKG